MIQIDEMIIRVPGLGKDEARELGEAVATNLAAELPDDFDSRQVNELNVGFSLPVGMSKAMMPEYISKQILQQLNTK